MSNDCNLDQIKAQAGSWSLQGDADMLDALVKISKNVIEKAEVTTRKVDDLCLNLDRADCDLQNISNSFTALANQQFIENRVAEEEPVIATEEKAKEKEISTSERNKLAKEDILRNSLAFVDKFFDVIEVPKANESDDEHSKLQCVFQLKNPHHGISLPYVIGSKEFEEDDFIGLRPAAAIVPKPVSDQVEELQNWESSSGEPISSEEDGLSASGGTQRSNQSSQRSSFLNELSTAIGNGTPPAAEVSQPKIPSLISAYAQREPPPLFGEDDEAEDSIFGSGANLFKDEKTIPAKQQPKPTTDGGNGSLFGDDEEDFFDKPVAQPSTMGSSEKNLENQPIKEQTKKLPPGAVSIFGNKPIMPKQRQPSSSSKSSLDEHAAVIQVPPAASNVFAVPVKQSSGLFSDDSDDDGDLFGASNVPKEVPKKMPLFDDLPPKPLKEDGQKKNNLFDSGRTSLFDDLDDNDLTINQPKAPEVISPNPVIGGKVPETSITKSKLSNETNPKAASPAIVPSNKISLFGDSDSDEDIFSTSKAPAVSDDSEDLFKPVAVAPKKSEVPKQDLFASPKDVASVPVDKSEPSTTSVDSTVKLERHITHPVSSTIPKSEKIVKPSVFSTASPPKEARALHLDLQKEPPKVANLFESPEADGKPKTPEPLTNKPEENDNRVIAAPSQSAVRRGLALNINPLALLPGSKPLKTPTPMSPTSPMSQVSNEPSPQTSQKTVKSPEKEAPPPPGTEPIKVDTASFDDAPKRNSQLLHLGKDRIRIKQKRKPPTRKGRPASTESPTDPLASNLVSPATDEDDLFVVSPAPTPEEIFTSSSEKEAETPSSVPTLGPSSIFNEPPPLPSKVDDVFGDDDDYLFSDPLPTMSEPKVDVRFSFEPPPLPTGDMGITVDNDLFAVSPLSPPADDKFSVRPNQKQKSPSIEGLFCSVEIEASNLFAENIENKTNSKSLLKPEVLSNNIFDDEDDDIFGSGETAVSDTQQTDPNSPVPKGKPQQNLSSGSVESESVDSLERNTSNTIIFRDNETPPNTDANSSVDMFAENDIFTDAQTPDSSGELLFETPPLPNEESFGSLTNKVDVFLTPDSSMEAPASKFQKSSEEVPKQVISNEPVALFGEDDDDDDLFASPASKPSQAVEDKVKPLPQPVQTTPKVTERKNVVHDLFAEDDDNDLFGAPTVVKSVPRKQPEATEKLSTKSEAPADDLFSSNVSGPSSTSKTSIIDKKKELIKKKSSALFGDLDDEENDLFGSAVKSKVPPKQQQKPQEKSDSQDLFDDPLLGGLG
ncbi:WASH complex subunit 2-like [Neocloeon triangulifer]|uniref:WASH complex subunit 2-like n=1 Tax=Neocloeon triangulifer TaxID=2078957 RepID=UPI00286FABDC|nr:WASH complex subunit 2-like [Neocloeon triangulifer]